MREGNQQKRPLATLLSIHLGRECLSVKTLAERLGVSQSYLSQLLAGDKPLSVVSDEFIRSCAELLGQPPIVCFLLSGKLRTTDFFETPLDFADRLEDALRIISESRYALESAAGLGQMKASPGSVQHLLVFLYEALTGVELMPGKVTRRVVEAAGQIRLPYEIRSRKPE